MTKTYSSKSNARRAGIAAATKRGIPLDMIQIIDVDGGFSFVLPVEVDEPAPAAAPVEEPAAATDAVTTADAIPAEEKPAKPKKVPKHEMRPDGLRVGSGLAVLVDTVCRPGGATNAELCAAVGWAQCLPAMRKAAAKAGVKVEVIKEKGQPARYVGTR